VDSPPIGRNVADAHRVGEVLMQVVDVLGDAIGGRGRDPDEIEHREMLSDRRQ
jgi:hypothetical protein